MDSLKFMDFKTKMGAKFAISSSSSAGSPADKDNVFTQLMHRIKTMEMTQAVYELYMNQVCTLSLLDMHISHTFAIVRLLP